MGHLTNLGAHPYNQSDPIRCLIKVRRYALQQGRHSIGGHLGPPFAHLEVNPGIVACPNVSHRDAMRARVR